MAVTELKPFKLWVLQNFPFIEEDFDALTNYEMMCKIVAKLNELVDVTNEQSKTFEYLEKAFIELKEYVDEHVEDVKHLEEAIDIINERLDVLFEQVNNNTLAIENLDSKIDYEIQNLDRNLKDLINQNYISLKSYVDYNYNILNEKIDNIQIGLINIYDPTSGTVQPLQTVINNLYQMGNKDGLTATEFDALDLTCTAFENYQITAYEFDSSGKLILL